MATDYFDEAVKGAREAAVVAKGQSAAEFDAWIAEIRRANAELRTAIIDSMMFRDDKEGLQRMIDSCRECNGKGWVTVLNDYGDGVESDECHGCREAWAALRSIERPQAVPLADRSEP